MPTPDQIDGEQSSPVQPADQEILTKRDYINFNSHPSLTKILHKQGDQEVLFADKLLKFTSSGKMKSRILLITDFAIYIVDPEIDSLKRRIALAAVDKICITTRKASDYELEVVSSNRFEYNAQSDLVKEIEFEEVEGGVKTRILRK
ncbi:unnamed protein product [Vicia faba]|uniref:TH1 domain-containing protein n=1 Tax=Vicia faba TaxID=3906 RepID=A0AAV0ZIF9_VICFA|nr:unnamed protein product [Vicia faba]